MKFMSYGLLFGEKQTHFFSKVHYILKKIKIMLRLIKNVLINELYSGKIFDGILKNKINALLLPNYKNHLGAKRIQKKWTQNGLSNL